MKRTSWNTALCCGLALSLSSAGLFVGSLSAADKNARADKGNDKEKGHGRDKGDDRDKGHGRDKGKPQGSRDTRPPAGDAARAQPSQGRNATPSRGRSGIHAPAIGEPRQSPSRGEQQPLIKRTPSFSRPTIGDSPQLRQPQSVPQQRQGSRPIRGQTHDGGFSGGAIRLGDQGLRNNTGFRDGTHRSRSSQSGIVNLPFVGNTVNFNNRSFNVGHSSYQPAYYRHSGYHGYWNGNRGFGGGSGFGIQLGSGLGIGLGVNSAHGGVYGPGWGWGLGSGYGYGGRSRRGHGGYGYRPFGWGLGGWGLGSLIYNSGYLGYSNPYYDDSYRSFGNYSYSQPIPVTYNASAVVDNDPNSSDAVLNNAVGTFQQNDYDAALDITNKGIAQYPDDAVLHEFRSLVLFARQDYQQAASTIHSVLAVGPGWDWTTLSSMYSDVAIYTAQLRSLEAFTEANPQDAASQFLLAYHYMSCGHSGVAARELRQVVKLMPNDRVAVDLLKMIEAPEPGQSMETPSQPEPQSSQTSSRSAAQPIDLAMLVGTWKAARADGSRFNLTLTNDAQFTWSFTQKGQAAQEFGGTYSVDDGNVLVLERAGGERIRWASSGSSAAPT